MRILYIFEEVKQTPFANIPSDQFSEICKKAEEMHHEGALREVYEKFNKETGDRFGMPDN